jgi:hypothetical protein
VDPQLVTAIVGLATITLGGLGTLITALVVWLARKLDTNTTLTTQARDASNGRLSETLERLALERNLVVGLRALIHERDDRLAYIVARLPEADALMTEYAQRNTRKPPGPAEEVAVEQRALGT